MNESLQQLVGTLLWSEYDNSTPEGGQPLDKNYDIHDVDAQSLEELQQRFDSFLQKAETEIAKIRPNWDGSSIDDFYTGSARGDFQTEHYYVLTVNEHGIGFWQEHEWPEVGKILTDLCRSEKQIHCFVEAGKVYFDFI